LFSRAEALLGNAQGRNVMKGQQTPNNWLKAPGG